MAQYEDIYVRDNFGDTGIYPSSGTPYQSPDIIPLQGGQMTAGEAVSKYGPPDLGKDIVSPGVNNIYVRSKNLYPGDQTGTASLYYATSSLLLVPSRWRSNPVQTAGGQSSVPFVNGSQSTTLHNGDIALVNSAFFLSGLPETNEHYCFIAIVTTPNHTVMIPTRFSSNVEFASWVMNSPAVAWRNFHNLRNPDQVFISSTNFASTDPGSAYFRFSYMGTGFPVGTRITAQCRDQRLPIDAAMTLPAPDIYGNQLTGFDQTIPGDYSGTLVNEIRPPQGGRIAPGAVLRVRYYQYPSANLSELEREVARPVEIGRETESGHEISAPTLIHLGEITIRIEEA